MLWWRGESLEALLKAKSEQEIFDHVSRLAQQIGFEYCAYGIQVPVPVSRPGVTMLNNYSPKWQADYVARNYVQVDPTVQHALKSNLPVIWSNELFASVPEFWEEARRHGLHHGWAQSARDANGAVGLLTFARSAEALSSTELDQHQPAMVWLAHGVHAAMSRILVPRLAPETRSSLTAREKEVLRWTAEGKTAYEVAQILAVSERTIIFHINNVVQKLGASNKTHAAVKAMALGLLS